MFSTLRCSKMLLGTLRYSKIQSQILKDTYKILQRYRYFSGGVKGVTGYGLVPIINFASVENDHIKGMVLF